MKQMIHAEGDVAAAMLPTMAQAAPPLGSRQSAGDDAQSRPAFI